MAKHSGRFTALGEKIDKTCLYSLEDAVALCKETATAKFDEAVEIAIKLNVNPSKGEQNVRGTITLPHGTGRVPRVAVFAEGEAAQQAEAAGADRVGGEDLVSAIDEGWEDFDILVAHPGMMRYVGRLGRILGPRMPNKKAGNITEDVGGAVAGLKAGKLEYRVDRGGVIHLCVGRASFEAQQLVENITALVDTIAAVRPPGVSGRYIVSAAMCSSMGPGVKLDIRAMSGVK